MHFQGRNVDDDDDYHELTGNLPTYSDSLHPKLAESATRALRVALEKAQENGCQIQDFWDVFQNFVCRYQHGVFVDVLVGELVGEVKAAIIDEKSEEIEAEIIEEIRDEIRKESQDAIFMEVAEELRETIEDEVRSRLILEVEPLLRKELRQAIMEEIRPQVEMQLRSQLMVDPEFMASVKADLQRKILAL